MLVYLVIYDPGKVSLEHLLLSRDSSQRGLVHNRRGYMVEYDLALLPHNLSDPTPRLTNHTDATVCAPLGG